MYVYAIIMGWISECRQQREREIKSTGEMEASCVNVGLGRRRTMCRPEILLSPFSLAAVLKCFTSVIADFPSAELYSK